MHAGFLGLHADINNHTAVLESFNFEYFEFIVQIYNFSTGLAVHLFTTLLAMEPSILEEMYI